MPFSGLIRRILDFFYHPFRNYVTLQFFRYGVVGGTNLVFDWVLYFVIYNFVLKQNMVELGFVTISSHIATLGIKVPIVLLSGFLMQKYITFSTSDIRGRVQLFRYIVVVLINLSFNYVGSKIMVEHLRFYPTLSNMMLSIMTIGISYFSQKHYTFKVANVK